MKAGEIEVGKTYVRKDARGRLRTRRVIAAGADFTLYSGQENADCVQYEDDKGKVKNSTRKAFASWADAVLE